MGLNLFLCIDTTHFEPLYPVVIFEIFWIALFISCSVCLSQKKYQSLCNLYPLRHNKQNVREQGEEQSRTELD